MHSIFFVRNGLCIVEYIYLRITRGADIESYGDSGIRDFEGYETISIVQVSGLK